MTEANVFIAPIGTALPTERGSDGTPVTIDGESVTSWFKLGTGTFEEEA